MQIGTQTLNVEIGFLCPFVKFCLLSLPSTRQLCCSNTFKAASHESHDNDIHEVLLQQSCLVNDGFKPGIHYIDNSFLATLLQQHVHLKF